MDYELEPADNKPGKEQPNDRLIPASILVAGLMISASIIYAVHSGNPATPSKTGQLAAVGANAGGNFLKLVPHDVILGNKNAPVTLIEYGDYQCPFCGRFFSADESQIKQNYVSSGKVKMVFRNLAFLGPESTKSAEAAECAKDQNKFWEYHDALYSAEIADGRENNGNLTRDLFIKLARGLGIDTKTFASCVDSNKYEKRITEDNVDAQASGVNSTPTSFVNGEKLQGALPYAQFAAAIEAALKSK